MLVNVVLYVVQASQVRALVWAVDKFILYKSKFSYELFMNFSFLSPLLTCWAEIGLLLYAKTHSMMMYEIEHA